MDTSEHIELGNCLRFENWKTLDGNPFIQINKDTKILSLNLQHIDNIKPKKLKLNLSAGEIVGMSGDYFGGNEVQFKLLTLTKFARNQTQYPEAISLGHLLINQPITPQDEVKLISSYNKLANKKIKRKEIDTINKINAANYVPFSKTLNEYVQQLMFALRVKNYGEILTRNLSHFTPWSVRAYTVGHYLALKYARLYFEFKQFAENPSYLSDNTEFNMLRKTLEQTSSSLKSKDLHNLAHHFQALSLGMELFCFHYYTDHFAAGHGAVMGDLRVELPKRFRIWGSILVNSLHDESNTVTLFTKRPYAQIQDTSAPPIEAGGDGNFNNSKNYFNKQGCIDGMQASLEDLHKVFQGDPPPEQSKYAGLEYLPDVDTNYRQPQPLFLLGNDYKIYYRSNLSKIHILSPEQFNATYETPLENGYIELSSIWRAFLLVIKLRLLPFLYQGVLQKLTDAELSVIEQDENERNPGRQSIPRLPKECSNEPTFVLKSEDGFAKQKNSTQELVKNSIFFKKSDGIDPKNVENTAGFSP